MSERISPEDPKDGKSAKKRQLFTSKSERSNIARDNIIVFLDSVLLRVYPFARFQLSLLDVNATKCVRLLRNSLM